MKRRTYTLIGIIVALALAIAVGTLARSPHVRAQQPDGQTNDPNERAPASISEDVAAAVAALPAGTAYVVLPPSAFVWNGVDDPAYRMNLESGYLTGMEWGTPCLAAPVHLPSGVTVVSLEVFAEDGLSVLNESFDLDRIPLAQGSPQEMAHVSTSYTTGRELYRHHHRE